MHISTVLQVKSRLIPALSKLKETFHKKSTQWAAMVKIGRTHLQDATPITLGQEFGGYAAQVDSALSRIQSAILPLMFLAQGGTAVGTGLNTFQGFDEGVVDELSTLTQLNFKCAPNKVRSSHLIFFLYAN